MLACLGVSSAKHINYFVCLFVLLCFVVSGGGLSGDVTVLRQDLTGKPCLTGTLCVGQASLELTELYLPSPSRCWD